MESTDQFIGYQKYYLCRCCLAFSAIREAAEKMVFNRTIHLRKNNELRWFELSIAPMKETDEHDTHFICLSRDITKVKLIDQSLRKVRRGIEVIR
jgi:PAS domain-containing protein